MATKKKEELTNGTGTRTASSTSGQSKSSRPFQGSSTGVTVYTPEQQAMKDEMNANSIAWHTASDEEKKRLEERNQELGKELSGTVTYDPNTGTWSGTAAAPVVEKPSFDYNSYVSENPRPTYESSYSQRIDEMLDAILSREDFTYKVEEDPLYQQYKEQYNREGNRAMEDTLATAAQNAGGMNSYAVTAAQQANDYYNAQLNDRVPQLYQLAYEMYLQDLENQVQDLGLLQSMDNTQYNRYLDTLENWYQDRNFAYNQYRDDMGDYQWNTDFVYGANRDQVADEQFQQSFDYQVGRDQAADREAAYDRAMEMIAYGVMPDDELLLQAGMSRETAASMLSSLSRTASGSGSGRSIGSGDQDYLGLFTAAMASGRPESFLANNYRDYGFQSKTGLYNEYKDWAEELENTQWSDYSREMLYAAEHGNLSKELVDASIQMAIQEGRISEEEAEKLYILLMQ